MSKVLLLFYQPFGAGDYNVWTPIQGVQAIQVGGLSGLAGSASVGRRRLTSLAASNGALNAAAETAQVLFGTTGALEDGRRHLEGPKPDSVEGVDQILQMTTDVAAGSSPLPIE